MEGESVFPESLRQHVQHPARIILQFEAYDQVIRVADEKAFAFHPRLYFPLKPDIEDFMKIDVRQKRR
jgi:hypothetical protein